AHIDEVLKSGGKSLSDESTYNDALGKLPSSALVKAYVSGPQLSKAIQQLQQAKGSGLAGTTPGLMKLDFISAALSAENDGLRVHGATGGAGSSDLASGTDDQSAALSTLDKLASRLAALMQAKVTTTHEAGHAVKTIDFTRFAVRYAGLGDKILITTGLNGIGAYTASGSKLPDAAD